MIDFVKSFKNKMLFCNRVSVSEAIDINKKSSNISRACYLCCFYFFKDKNFSYQPYICSSCLKLTQRITNKILYYDRISVSEGIGADKTGSYVSKSCDFAISTSLKTKTLMAYQKSYRSKQNKNCLC